jgi:1-acyl-sn-glycerol-3-phosphate acyltransferase
MGMQLHTAGDVISEAQRREGALILSNHPSTADWMYLFSWLPRQGSLLHLKIVLKGALHGAPVIGWALQCCRYLFLERNWEKDQKHMECIVQHWAKAGTRVGAPTDDQPAAAAPVQLLLFPEGTDLRPVSFDQSAAFVAKSAAAGMQLIPFEHLLQPRVTGFVHLVKLLRSTGSVKAVYDLTLASTPVPVTIENLARGVAPEHFHVHLRRFDLAALPKDDAALAQWLLQRWTEKEKLLQGFYAQPATAVGAQQQRSFPRSDEQDALERRLARQMQLLHFSALFLFGLLGLLHLYALYARPLLLLFLHAALSGVWVWLSRSPHNGFDRLILHNDQAAEEQLQQPPQSTAPTNLVNKKAQ